MEKSKNKQLELEEIVATAPNLEGTQPDELISQSEIYERQLHYLATVRTYLEMQLQQTEEMIEEITLKISKVDE